MEADKIVRTVEEAEEAFEHFGGRRIRFAPVAAAYPTFVISRGDSLENAVRRCLLASPTGEVIVGRASPIVYDDDDT